jgi:hypothetical protein
MSSHPIPLVALVTLVACMVPMAARDNGHLEHFRLTEPNSKNRFCGRMLSLSSS